MKDIRLVCHFLAYHEDYNRSKSKECRIFEKKQDIRLVCHFLAHPAGYNITKTKGKYT